MVEKDHSIKYKSPLQRTEITEATTSCPDTIDRNDNRHLTSSMQVRTQNREKRRATSNQHHNHHRAETSVRKYVKDKTMNKTMPEKKQVR